LTVADRGSTELPLFVVMSTCSLPVYTPFAASANDLHKLLNSGTSLDEQPKMCEKYIPMAIGTGSRTTSRGWFRYEKEISHVGWAIAAALPTEKCGLTLRWAR